MTQSASKFLECFSSHFLSIYTYLYSLLYFNSESLQPVFYFNLMEKRTKNKAGVPLPSVEILNTRFEYVRQLFQLPARSPSRLNPTATRQSNQLLRLMFHKLSLTILKADRPHPVFALNTMRKIDRAKHKTGVLIPSVESWDTCFETMRRNGLNVWIIRKRSHLPLFGSG
jgi:hypothetical protein